MDIDPDRPYPMHRPRLGDAVIVNNVSSEMPGSNADVAALRAAYESIGLDVHVHTDCSNQQMRNVKKFIMAEDTHRDSNCLILTIICHGNDKGQLLDRDRKKAWDTELFIGELSDVESLTGKPKIMVIQSCRGAQVSEDRAAQTLADVDDRETTNILPDKADMFLAYATVPGFRAHGGGENGSIYLQALAKYLQQEYMRRPLNKILQMVRQHMVQSDQDSRGMKQCPEERNSLLYDVQFSEYHRHHPGRARTNPAPYRSSPTPPHPAPQTAPKPHQQSGDVWMSSLHEQRGGARVGDNRVDNSWRQSPVSPGREANTSNNRADNSWRSTAPHPGRVNVSDNRAGNTGGSPAGQGRGQASVSDNRGDNSWRSSPVQPARENTSDNRVGNNWRSTTSQARSPTNHQGDNRTGNSWKSSPVQPRRDASDNRTDHNLRSPTVQQGRVDVSDNRTTNNWRSPTGQTPGVDTQFTHDNSRPSPSAPRYDPNVSDNRVTHVTQQMGAMETKDKVLLGQGGPVTLSLSSTHDTELKENHSFAVIPSAGEVILCGLEGKGPWSYYIYSYDHGGFQLKRVLKVSCKHEVEMLPFRGASYSSGGIQQEILTACEWCKKIKLVDLVKDKTTTVFSDSDLWAGRMCHGAQGTVLVYSLGKVLELEVQKQKLVGPKKTIDSGLSNCISMVYIAARNAIVLSDGSGGVIRAVSCAGKKNDVLWEVKGIVDGALCDPRGLLYHPGKDLLVVCDGSNTRLLVLDPRTGDHRQTIAMPEVMGEIEDMCLFEGRIVMRHTFEHIFKVSFFSVC